MIKIQKYLYYLLFLITPFVMYSGTSELFEFNKMIFIYIVTTGILAVWLTRMVQEGRILFKKTPLDIFIILFVASQVLSTLFSIDRHVSIFGYYGRFNGGLLSIAAYLILYYSLAEFIAATREGIPLIKNLLKITVFSSTAVILWGLPGKAGHDLSCLVFSGKLDNKCWTAQFDPAARMFSTLGQPNWLGAYLAIAFFAVLYFFLQSSSLLWIPLLLLNLVAIFFTNSRSSILAVYASFAAVALWVALFRKKLGIPQFRLKAQVLAAGFILCVLVFKTGVARIDKYLTPSTYFKSTRQSAPAPVPAKQAAASPLKVTESLDIRKIVWQGAIDLGFQYPLFGTGVETFAYSYYFVRPAAHNLTSEWDYLYNKAHNEYLNYFATTGFTGTAAYLLFIGAVLALGVYWTLLRKDKDASRPLSLLQVCLLGSWLTILITNFVGFSTTVINLYFYAIPLLLFVIEGAKDHNPAKAEKRQAAKNGGGILSYVVIVVGTLFLLQYFVTYWMADTRYALGENYAKANDYQSAVQLISDALKLYHDHVYEDKLSYYMANLAFIAAYQKDTRLSGELMKAGEAYNLKSLGESPENILYWKTRVKNQYLFYQITLDKKYLNQGIEALKKSEVLSPTDPKIPYFLATYDSLLSDEEKDPAKKALLEKNSLVAVNRSLELKNDYFESYYLKAQLLRKYKRTEEAKQIYEYILKYISPNNQEILKELQSI